VKEKRKREETRAEKSAEEHTRDIRGEEKSGGGEQRSTDEEHRGEQRSTEESSDEQKRAEEHRVALENGG
jgi:hypothetical protein